MTDHDKIKLVYTGSSVDASFLKSIFEDNGIGVMVRDSLKESTIAGWASGAPEDACRVFVAEKDFDAAEKLVEDYKKSNK